MGNCKDLSQSGSRSGAITPVETLLPDKKEDLKGQSER